MLIIAAVQVPPLLRNQQHRELFGFALVWVMATGLSILVTADINLPNLVDVIETLYSFLGWIE